MAHCVVSNLIDTDLDGDAVVLACMVHITHAPCPHDGEPASPSPLHGDAHPSREEVIALWAARTNRQRPLHIHRGDLADGSHLVETEGVCQCGPEILEPELAGTRNDR